MKESESINHPEMNINFDKVAQDSWNTYEERRLDRIQEDTTIRSFEIHPSYVWSFIYAAEGHLCQEKLMQSYSAHPDMDGKIVGLEKTLKAFMNTKVVKRSELTNNPSLLRVKLNSRNVMSLHDFVAEYKRLQPHIEFEEERAIKSLSEKIENEYLEAPIVEKKVNKFLSRFRKKD